MTSSESGFESSENAVIPTSSPHSTTYLQEHVDDNVNRAKETSASNEHGPPLVIYFALSLLRAMDIGLTNGAMKFLNYPAKTLIKSSRVAFTMFGGMIVGKKNYRIIEYVMVTMLVLGLSIFLHADYKSKAVFHPIGVFMLVSLKLIHHSYFQSIFLFPTLQLTFIVHRLFRYVLIASSTTILSSS